MSQTNHNILNSRANLRAQRHVRSQQMSPAVIHLRQQTQESQILEERSPRIVKCFQTFQWKYGIDAHSPRWKKLFFRLVYLPFIRFCLHRLGIAVPEAIILPNANLPKGALLFKEWQGCFSEKWAAEQEAARHLHGGYTEVNFNWSEPAATVIAPRSACNESKIDKRRMNGRDWEQDAALELLQETLVRTRPQMESFRSAGT